MSKLCRIMQNISYICSNADAKSDSSECKIAFTIPIFAWEMALAVWLIVKGFNSSVIASFQHVSQ